MTKQYYKKEYTETEWMRLIDKAAELGCQVSYSKYGNIATIDSIEVENRVLRQESHRLTWAEHIHGMIEKAARESQLK